jgi:hypothetical protein
MLRAVPLLLYFVLMWTSGFALIYYMSGWRHEDFNYESAAVQSFTAGSNNFVRHFSAKSAVSHADRTGTRDRDCYCDIRRRLAASTGRHDRVRLGLRVDLCPLTCAARSSKSRRCCP